MAEERRGGEAAGQRGSGAEGRIGYRMPAEWAPHRGTWLSWPHRDSSWPDKFEPVPRVFAEIVRHLAPREEVHINVVDPAMEAGARGVDRKSVV